MDHLAYPSNANPACSKEERKELFHPSMENPVGFNNELVFVSIETVSSNIPMIYPPTENPVAIMDGLIYMSKANPAASKEPRTFSAPLHHLIRCERKAWLVKNIRGLNLDVYGESGWFKG